MSHPALTSIQALSPSSLLSPSSPSVSSRVASGTVISSGLRYLFMISALLGVMSAQVYAEGSVTVSADREVISKRQTVRVTVTVDLAGISSQANIAEPSWRESGWQVLGRSNSTSISIINGQRSLERTYQYQLKPIRTGELKIGPFSGQGSARGISSNVVTVRVTEKTPPKSAARQRRDRSYGQLRWDADRREVWVGEPIVSTLTIYALYPRQAVDLDIPDINLKGFWVDELEPPRRSPRAQLNGRVYNQQVIKRDLITPIESGELSLPSFDVRLTLRKQSLFGESMELDLTVDPLPIKVKPLPPNPPPGFKGPAVGEVKLTATLDRSKVKLGEGAQLIIKTETTGLLPNTPKIELPFIDQVKIFPPTEREVKRSLGGQELRARVQTWIIKPERAGTFTIPSLELPYFDPALGTYQVAKTRAFKITARGAKTARTTDLSALTPREQKRLDQSRTAKRDAADKLDVQLSSVLTEPLSVTAGVIPDWVWWLIGLFGPCVLIISEVSKVWGRLRERSSPRRAQARAAQVALGELTALKPDALDYGALDQALLRYLSVRLQRELRGATRDKISETLSELGLSDELIQGYTGLCEAIDFARFARADQTQAREVLTLATQWIKLIERALTETSRDTSDPKSKLNATLLLGWALISAQLITPDLASAQTIPKENTRASAQASTQTAQGAWAGEGNEAFWLGQYKRAARLYKRDLKRAPRDVGLWYNLGTARAHQGRFGEAAYALERGLMLAPQASRLIEQRAKVHQAIIEESVRRPSARRLILPDTSGSGGALALLTDQTLRAVTLTLLSLTCLFLVRARRYSALELEELTPRDQLSALRKLALARALSALCAFACLVSGAIWMMKSSAEPARRGVITAHRVSLHLGPGERYKAELDIASAVSVELQGERDGWRRVRLAGGQEGWVRADEVGALED